MSITQFDNVLQMFLKEKAESELKEKLRQDKFSEYRQLLLSFREKMINKGVSVLPIKLYQGWLKPDLSYQIEVSDQSLIIRRIVDYNAWRVLSFEDRETDELINLLDYLKTVDYRDDC